MIVRWVVSSFFFGGVVADGLVVGVVDNGVDTLFVRSIGRRVGRARGRGRRGRSCDGDRGEL
jgi:hypothetical protein